MKSKKICITVNDTSKLKNIKDWCAENNTNPQIVMPMIGNGYMPAIHVYFDKPEMALAFKLVFC